MDKRDDPDVRRLVYTSTRLSENRPADLDVILAQSRHNNGMNGVSGVLLAVDDSYLQVLSDTRDYERAFGDWAMANLSGTRGEAEVRRRLHRLLRDAPESVKGAFAILD